MNDLLPLLAFPLAYGWYFTSRRYERELHGTLRSATAEQPPHPLLDAGPVPVLRVAASLALPQAANEPSTPARRLGTGRRARLSAFSAFVAPLGLRLEGQARRGAFRRGGDPEAVRIVGERHGARVEVVLCTGRQEVALGTTGHIAFRVHGSDGLLQASPESPASLQTGLQGLQRHRRWHGLTITGGPGWVRLERRTPGAASWVHDLWLAEFVRDLALLVAPDSAREPRRERVLVATTRAEAGLAGRGQTAGG